MMNLLARLPVIAISVQLVVLAALLSSHSVSASLLYQWITADGTPTYSPEPPPKGVSYTIVGADLQPIKGQVQSQPAPQQASGANNSLTIPSPLPARSNTNLVMTPTPGTSAVSKKAAPTISKKPKNVWKPVKYADDPNPDVARPSFSSNKASASIASPISTISEECIRVRQRLSILESQFANAQGATQMDAAVLRLSAFRKQTKGLCDQR